VIGQDKVAKSGKANEVTHFRPLLEPLPLQDVLVTADAMQATRDNARFLRQEKNASTCTGCATWSGTRTNPSSAPATPLR
jgi:hypothetical protein